MCNQGFKGFLGFEPLFCAFRGFVAGLYGRVHIATDNLRVQINRTQKKDIYIYPIILSPIRGGAIIGVFMI
jgi:hypothetical protein